MRERKELQTKYYEIYTQHLDGKQVAHPHLPSAEELNPLDDRLYKILSLYEQRRLDNSIPPSIREIGKELEIKSTSHVDLLVKQLVKGDYLEKIEGTGKSRSTQICVNFLTVQRRPQP